MQISYLIKRIEELSQSANIIVLKGFQLDDVKRIKNKFKLLDEYIIKYDRIDLKGIDYNRLIIDLISKPKFALLSYESFLRLTTMMRNISGFGLKFCILRNNLIDKYENQTNLDIPDFDSTDFLNNLEANDSYALYYSYCEQKGNKQYLQYIEYYTDDESIISNLELVQPVKLKIESELPEGTYETLIPSTQRLVNIKQDIFDNKPLQTNYFIIEKENLEDIQLTTLQGISDALHLGLKFFFKTEAKKVIIRKDLYNTMKDVWGYDSFRELSIYKDLMTDHTTIKVSQGEVIETVIEQVESAFQTTDNQCKNILLTAPTGAGKSLLFQMAAIYIAERYKRITIVVSPLVALMNDQVDNLVGNYNKVGTLNGNIPASQKEDVLEKVRNGEILILYLAPELLLSYTIKSFIGEQEIGLFVIDEAHTVTTWGRDFRVDYWFLGDYLRQTKRFLNYDFPIFALTATAVWDPSGKNDMVFDTIHSLNMDPCIKYIGVSRRDDIRFEIEQSDIATNYEKKRNELTIKRIKEFIDKGYKTVVYFPYKSSLKKVMQHDDIKDYADKVTEYHASLFPAEKLINAEDFKTGRKIVMCATKAYGMGIDVRDIKMVYHHAPTGGLSDYVQEIGRVARDPSITGIAKIDFSEKDFKFSKALHGLSAIKSYQLYAVLKKLMAIYKLNGEKRNMLISASDFAYIFPGNNIDYDQKVKSCLLLLSNDLLNKLRFNAIIVRPKNLFSKSFIKLTAAQAEKFEKEYSKYVTLIDKKEHIYRVDIDELWTKKYSNLSFPNFKRKLALGEVFTKYNIYLVYKIDITLNLKDCNKTKNLLEDFFDQAASFIDKMIKEHRRLGFEEMKLSLPAKYSNIGREAFLESFKMVFASPCDIPELQDGICTTHPDKGGAFQVANQGYERYKALYLRTFIEYIKQQNNIIYCDIVSPMIKVAELLNSLNLAEYIRQGGDEPAIFVRINNPAYLNDIVKYHNYENDILNGIYDKFDFSQKVFKYFFTTNMSDKERWDFIEAYFLGADYKELISIHKKKE